MSDAFPVPESMIITPLGHFPSLTWSTLNSVGALHRPRLWLGPGVSGLILELLFHCFQQASLIPSDGTGKEGCRGTGVQSAGEHVSKGVDELLKSQSGNCRHSARKGEMGKKEG